MRSGARQTSDLLDSTLDRCKEAIWRSDCSSDGTTRTSQDILAKAESHSNLTSKWIKGVALPDRGVIDLRGIGSGGGVV